MKIRKIASTLALGTMIESAVVLAAMHVPAEPAAPRAKSISIEHFEFLPKTLTVPNGTTVTWANHDKEIHTATSRTGAFASAGLDPNETFSYRFTKPGTYTYYCALHPNMTATIVVR